ncbi:MAG: protein kinase [Kofleriaceae bacterium]
MGAAPNEDGPGEAAAITEVGDVPSPDDAASRTVMVTGDTAPPPLGDGSAPPAPAEGAVGEARGRRRKPRTSMVFAATAVGEPEQDTFAEAGPDGSAPRPRAKEPEVELEVGLELGGRYRVLSLLGRGGMGSVYAVQDADLEEVVALKLLHAQLAHDPEYRQRLRGEVRLARRVSHPNVCRVHDLGQHEDLVFVTMELVPGRSLREVLTDIRAGRAAPMDLAQIVDLVGQVCAALAAAHRAGVVHRDVKPDNIVVTDGRAVLTDFGVASLSADGGARIVAGTPAYIAPEVLRGEPFDHKVDVYAVAVVAYELLTGRTPVAAKSLDLATKAAFERPPYPPLPPEFATPSVRAAMDRVLARALASDPVMRTAAIERLAEALAQAARGAPTTTTSMPIAAFAGGEAPSLAQTQSGSIRRPELRVATALVYQGDSAPSPSVPGVTSTSPGEAWERVVVDAGGTPVRVTASDLVAVFGVPQALGDDAERAARAALTLVERFGGKAGLDTTRVLLRPGAGELVSLDAAATALALASRERSGGVLASPAAARQLAARFEIETLRAHDPPARRITGIRAGGSDAAGTIRTNELAELDARLERCFRERTPAFVEVRGAAGLGKTRLRDALVAAVSRRREVEWLGASGSPVGEPAPLELVRGASADWLAAATADGGDHRSVLAGARRWVEARANRRPVAIVVDDAQWLDDTSRDVLAHLRAELDDLPVAIVTFVRVDDAAAAAPPPPEIALIPLAPLDDATALALARQCAPTASAETLASVVARAAGNPFFVEELAREVGDRAAANATTVQPLPASVEAMLQTRLDRLGDHASAVVRVAAVMGRTFWRDSLTAALDALAATAPTGRNTGELPAALLQAARAVADDGADAETTMDEALAELERAGLIAAVAPATFADDRYQFTQALVRDVAYASVPPRDRRRVHGQLAGWLEQHAERADRGADSDVLMMIAYHREQAGDTELAAAAYRTAGLRCLELFAYREAVVALRWATALAKDAPPMLWERLGDALSEVDSTMETETAYQRAYYGTDEDDAPTRARLLQQLATAAARRGDTNLAIERFRAGLALAAPGGEDDARHAVPLAPWAGADPRTAAALYAGLGWVLGYLLGAGAGHDDEALAACERGVALLEGTPHRRELAHALSRLGGCYMRATRFRDQLKCNQRNLGIGQELADLKMQLTARINLGVVFGVLGDIPAALEHTERAVALAQRLGATASAGIAASNLAGLLLEAGRLDEAADQLDDAIDLLERADARSVFCETHLFSARLAAARGDLAAAIRHADRSLALGVELGAGLEQGIALRVLAQLHARAGRPDDALRDLAAAADQIGGLDAFEAARTDAARARVLARAGDAAGAAAARAAARARFTAFGAQRELAVLDDDDEVR